MSDSNATGTSIALSIDTRKMPVLAGALFTQITTGIRGTITDDAIAERALKLTTEKLAADARDRCNEIANLSFYRDEPEGFEQKLGLAKAAMAEFIDFITYRESLRLAAKVAADIAADDISF